MYKVYLTTGILLLLAGITTTGYLLWFYKNNKLKYEGLIISLVSQAIATAFIGLFYVYSVIAMLNNLNLQETPLFNILDHGQYLDLTEFNNEIIQGNFTTGKTEVETGFGEVQPDDYIEHILNPSVTQSSDYTPGTEELKPSMQAGQHILNGNTVEDLGNSKATQKLNSQDQASQFLINYREFLKNVLNKSTFEIDTQSPVLKRRKERTLINETGYKEKQPQLEILNDTKCLFKNIFLQHVMLTYSFVHGMITLINSVIHCKGCTELTKRVNQEKPSPSIEDSSSKDLNTSKAIQNLNMQENAHLTVELNTKNPKSRQKYKTLMQLFTTLLVPPLFASSLYFIMQNGDSVPTISNNQYISNILQNPTNMSTVENANQIRNVVENIYQIITEVKTNPNLIIPKLSFIYQNSTAEATSNCYNPSMSLKIYTFFVFIVGYFIVMLYSQTIYAKLDSSVDPVTSRSLKIILLGFSSLWLPSALEMFSRIYLYKSLPDLVAELLTALGNVSHILMNIGSVLMTKTVAKNQNHVQPIV